ncbi:tetratricopeptide repeat protein [Psychroserpens sp.]|uniref:tetratricopeptide repeat protein n=1 Tax=Psychroserpens sp. TaxID=2020870 RepID=UPI002B26723C|nr:tetratricopeptide repeat protein [Psychroserpens sp.]
MITNQSTIRTKIIKPFVSILFYLFIAGFCSLNAQSSSVITNIRFNNANATKVTLTVNGKSYAAQIGSTLNSGTKLIIPSNTVVLLKSPNGVQVCMAKSKPMEYSVEFKGGVEKHIVKGKGATIQSKVNRGVGPNYRVTNGRGTTTASRTTEFTFTDQSEGKNNKASVITTEGSVNIIDQVPVYVGGNPLTTKKRGTALTKSISISQSQGESEYFANDTPAEYDNYSDAIQDVYSDISDRNDPDDQANNYLCLGELYIDTDQPQEAIGPFRQAASIYNEYYGYDDMSTIEANLSLAEALKAVDSYNSEGDSILYNIEVLLREYLSFDMEDLQYTNDPEERELICEDVTEINEFLGWLYDIKGDITNSDYFYNQADNGCY